MEANLAIHSISKHFDFLNGFVVEHAPWPWDLMATKSILFASLVSQWVAAVLGLQLKLYSQTQWGPPG